MARVTGKNGAVSFVSGMNADFSGWNLQFAHPVDDDTSYSDTGNGSSHSGSGTMDYNLRAMGFLKSNVASSTPGFADVTAAGGAVTCTAHTGCTEAATFVLSGGEIDHRKRSGAIAVSYNGQNDGNLTETWATT